MKGAPTRVSGVTTGSVSRVVRDCAWSAGAHSGSSSSVRMAAVRRRLETKLGDMVVGEEEWDVSASIG